MLSPQIHGWHGSFALEFLKLAELGSGGDQGSRTALGDRIHGCPELRDAYAQFALAVKLSKTGFSSINRSWPGGLNPCWR